MKQSRQENMTYLVVWGLLFAAPLLSLYVRTVNDANIEFDWSEVFLVWRKFAVYLVLFLVHNFLLAPLLVHQRKHVAYFSIVAVVIAAFTVYQCSSRPTPPHGPRGEFDRPSLHNAPPPERTNDPHRFPPAELKEDFHRVPPGGRKGGTPPPIAGERDILGVVMLVLMFGANLGIKGYFRGRDDRNRLVELEKQNLEQQLEYLRYQINPHFFMNTLNNIHALVDIDSEKAKDTILELSRMMRFVLYEGNKQSVPLSRELDFIRHYVALMQLRYTDKVRIDLDLPSEVQDRQIPPLILITFIENAFKHGVSYQHESFVEMKVSVEGDELHFTCRNSKAGASPNPPEQGKTGGVGLANVRKRLNLLYGENYSLRIHNVADVYSVELAIPFIS